MRSIPVRWSLLGVVLIAIVVYGGAGLVRAVRASGGGHDHTVFSAQLPNVPGKTLTAIVVELDPFTNCIVAGERYDLDAEDVIAYCEAK